MVNQKCKVNGRGFCKTLIEFKPEVYERLFDEKQAASKAGTPKTYSEIVNEWLSEYHGDPIVIAPCESDHPEEGSSTQNEMVKKG